MPRSHRSCARPAACSWASSRRTSSRSAVRPSTCRGRLRAIHGIAITSPAARRVARERPPPRACCRRPSARDTGGSVRNPASMCGVVGIKPTYGLVSRRGVMPLAFSLDHIGPLTRTVHDNALMLDLIAGYDALDPGSAQHAPTGGTRPSSVAASKACVSASSATFTLATWQADPEMAAGIEAAREGTRRSRRRSARDRDRAAREYAACNRRFSRARRLRFTSNGCASARRITARSRASG